MGAHLGTHREGKLHLIKRSLQIGGRNRSNNSAAFVALDIRFLCSDDALETAATVGCSEIGMR